MPSKRDAMTARALALVGCGYIYGATGWICTRARMEQQMRQYPAYAGQIERYGKKWIGKPCYDCAQLTRDVARRAGVSLPSGATSQWRAAGIWKEKDVIDTLPDEAGIFLFTMRDGRMTHTGVSVGHGEEVDARGHAYGVVRRPIRGTTFTHWARLAVDYDAQEDAGEDAGEETPPKPRRTLRMGSSGEDVRALQTVLQTLGFLNDAADGKFGAKTREAVRKFQKKSGLAVDGIVGAATWAALPEGDGEPSAPTRIFLTGDGMRALIRALEKPQTAENRLTFTLAAPDYGEIMRQIHLEI